MMAFAWNPFAYTYQTNITEMLLKVS